MKAIVVEGVSFTYGDEPVIENVTFEVPEKDFLAIIGPNGGGKTTLLKILMGILEPTKGRVTIYGKPPRVQTRIIGYVPQETGENLDVPITVSEVVLTGLLHRRDRWRRFRAEQMKKAIETLNLVGVSKSLANRRISELSGGQRQRVLIARALVSDPKILVLDEPTASIDFAGQHEIFELLERLNEKMTILVVSHDMSMVMGYARHALYVQRSAVMHTVDAHTRYQIKKQFIGRDGHFCGAEFWRSMSHSIACTKACEHD